MFSFELFFFGPLVGTKDPHRDRIMDVGAPEGCFLVRPIGPSCSPYCRLSGLPVAMTNRIGLYGANHKPFQAFSEMNNARR